MISDFIFYRFGLSAGQTGGAVAAVSIRTYHIKSSNPNIYLTDMTL